MITKNINGQNISQAFIDQIKSDSPDTIARLVMDGSVIDCSIISVEITKGSCGAEAFTIGSVVGDILKASVKDLSVVVQGKVIDCQIGANIGANYEYISLGLFTVSEAKKTRYTTEITAFSGIVANTTGMFDFSGISVYSINNIKNALASQMGVTITLDSGIDTSLVLDSKPVEATLYQMLAILTTTCGGYAVNTNDGNIAIKLYNSTPTATFNTGMSTRLPEIEERPFIVDSVKCVVTGTTEDDYYSAKYYNLIARKTTDYVIVDQNANPFKASVKVSDASVVFESGYVTQEIFNANIIGIIGYEYYPAKVHVTLADPRLEGSDVLEVADVDGSTYNVPCHQIKFTYAGALNADIVAVKATEIERSVGTTMPVSEKIATAQTSADNAQASADEALQIAGDTTQHFWFKGDGTDTGAHITEVPQAQFESAPAGGNLLARSNGIAIREGLTELAKFAANLLQIGRDGLNRVLINNGSIQAYDNDNNKYFEVSANSMSYGANTVADTDDVATAESNAKTYAEGKANTAESNAKTYAEGKANTAESNAKTYADGKIAPVSTVANEAKQIASDTAQYFWFKSTGSDTGAHITEKTKSQFEANPSGSNLLARSTGLAIREGLTELATFGANLIQLGKNSARTIIELCGGSGTISSSNVDGVPELTFKSTNGSSGSGRIAMTTANGLNKVALTEYTDKSLFTAQVYSPGNTRYNGILYIDADADAGDCEGSLYGYAKGALAGMEYDATDVSGDYSFAKLIASKNQWDISTLEITRYDDRGEATFSYISKLSSPVALTVTSDRRLKEHIAYLEDEACEFIRNLKPVFYEKDDQNHVGFYAQDIEEIDPYMCMVGETNGYKTLGYTELIAPLVRYCQSLEERVAELEDKING